MTLANPVAFAPGVTSVISGSNNLNLAGPIVLSGVGLLSVTNTAMTTLSGAISGPGYLTMSGSGTLSLAASANTLGGIAVVGGTLVLPSAAALGTGSLGLGGGTLLASGPLSLANPLLLTGTSSLAGSNALTFTGTTTLEGNTTLNVANSTTLSGVVGEVGGSRSLTAAGSGTLSLAGANTFSGGFNLSTPVTSSAPGLLAMYYDLAFSPTSLASVNYNATPNATRVEASISYPNILTSLPAGINQTNIAAQWVGLLNIVQAGTYVFDTNNDDGAGTYVDGVAVAVLDRLAGFNATPAAGAPIFLSAGLHTFRTLFYQAGGGAGVVVRYTGPDTGGNPQVVAAQTTPGGPGLVTPQATAVGKPTVVVGTNTSLGTGPVALNAGVLQASSAVTLANPLAVNSAPSAPVTFAGSAITFTSPLSVASGIGVAANNTTTFTGAITGPTTATAGSFVTGFGGDGTGWTFNSAGIGGTPVTTDMLTLTDGANGESRSAFFNTQVQPTGGFTVAFTYTPGGSLGADGTTFTLQNDPRGTAALGGGGGSFGYNGIINSVAVELNIYTGAAGGIGTALGTAATPIPAATPVTPVTLNSGDPISVILVYNASAQTITETLTDSIASTTKTTTFGGVNLLSLLGSTSAYMGFTGATGGANSIQTVSNFVYVPTTTVPTIGLTQGGTGNLVLTAANTFPGTVTVGNGTLTLSGNGALTAAPAASAVQTLVFGANVTGGTFTLTFNGQTTAPITWDPTPATLVSNIQAALNALSTIGTGNTLVAGTGPFTITFQNALANRSVPTMTFDATNLTGDTIQLLITVTPGASGLPAVAVNQGGTLTLDNTGTNNTDRIANSAPITLSGGTLNFLGNATAASTETVGALTLGAGTSTVNTTPGTGQTAALTFASLTRAVGSGGAVNFTGTGLGGASNKVLFTTAPTLTSGLLPYATVNGTELASYTAANGAQTYTASGGTYKTTVTASTAATDNVNLASNDTVTASKTINSLTITGDRTLTINPGVTLTVTSGALLVTGTTAGAQITGGGTLVLGQAIITTAAGSILTVNTPLSGTNLTLAGSGTVNLPTANAFTGSTTLAGATLNLGDVKAIGAGGLALVSGTLTATATGGLLLTNPLTFNNSVVTLGGTNPLLFSGAANLLGTNNTLTVTNTAATVLDGVVGGAANLTKAGPGTLVLAGANTFTGQTNVNAGILQAQSGAALGSVVVVAAGASVQVLGSGLTIASSIFLNGTGVNGAGALENLGGGNNTWSGGITLLSAATISIDAGTTLTVPGLAGPGDFTKVGAGTLVITSSSTYTGQTNINQGVVNVQNGLALGLPTGAVMVNTGAVQNLAFTGAPTGGTFVLNVNGTNTAAITYSTTFSTLQANISAALAALPAIGSAANVAVSGTARSVVITFQGTLAGASWAAITVTTNSLTGGTAPGILVTTNSASLQLQNTITVPGKNITLNGPGFGFAGGLPQGALVNQANNNSWTGDITLANGAMIGGVSGTTLTVGGVVSGTDLTKVGADAVILLGSNTFTGNLTVNAGVLTLSNANAYTGATTVNYAAIGGTAATGSSQIAGTTFGATALVLNNFGTILNSSSITLNGAVNPVNTLNVNNRVGGTLTLDNTAYNLVDNGTTNQGRLGNTTPINMNGGTLNFAAAINPGVASAETLGPVTLAGGQSLIRTGYMTVFGASGASSLGFTVQPAGATSTLTFSSLARNPGATVNFDGGVNNYTPINTTSNQIVVTAPLAAAMKFVGHQGTILPFAEVGGGLNAGDLAGVTTTAGVTNIVPFTNYLVQTVANNGGFPNPVVLTGGPLDIVKLVSNGSGVDIAAVNGATEVGTTATITTTTPHGFVVGQIVNINNVSLNGAAVGTYNGQFTITSVPSPTTFTITTGTANTAPAGGGAVSATTGTGSGIIVNAAFNQTIGALVMANNVVANPTANSIPLQINTNGSFSVASGAYIFTSTSGLQANVVNIQASATSPIVLPGETYLFQNSTGNVNFGNNTGFTGTAITGPGSLDIAGTNNVFLGNNTTNTYTGGTYINSGTVINQNSANFGTGAITFTGGIFQTNNNPTVFSNALNLNGSQVFTNNPVVFTGAITLTNNDVLNYTNQVYLNGSIGESGGSRSLTVAGTSATTLILNNANTFTGGTILATTTNFLQVNNPNALGTGTFTLTSGVLGTTQNVGANNSVTIPNAVLLPNTSVTVNSIVQGVNVNFAGPTTLVGNNTLNLSSSGTTAFTGGVVGSGALTMGGSGVLQLPTANWFTGGFALNGTTTVLGSNAALGTGPVSLGGGTLTDSAPITLANAVVVSGTSAGTLAGTSAITFTGSTTLLSSTTLTVNNSAGVTFSGVVGEAGGSKALTLAGTGAVSLLDANYFSAGFNLNNVGSLGVLAQFYNLSFGPGGGALVGPPNGTQTVFFNQLTPVFSRIDSSINYPNNGNGFGSTVSGATGNSATLPASVNPFMVAAQFSGSLNIATGGSYTFTTSSDDNSDLYIDGVLVVNNDFNQGNTARSSTVTLAAGPHTFLAQYINNGGGAAMTVNYSGPDTGNASILIPAATSLTGPGLVTAGAASNTLLTLGNNAALGSGAVNFTSGVVTASAPLTITNPVTFSSSSSTANAIPLAFAGSPITITSNVNLTNDVVLSVNNTTTLSGVVSGTGSLTLGVPGGLVAGSTTLAGTGNLVLTAAETYTGSTTVNAGTLTLSGGGALTATSGGTSAVQTLTFNPAVTGGTFTLTFAGQTTSPISWDPTPANLVSNIQAGLDGLSTIGAGNTLVAGTGPAYTITFQSSLANANVPTLAFNGSALTGAGILSLATTTTGGAAVNVNQGGTLTLDNTGTNSLDRINDTAGVTLNGGTLSYLSNANAASTETLGALALGAGNSTISSTVTTGGSGAAATLTFASLTRNSGATVNFVGVNTALSGAGANQVVFTTTPTTTTVTGGNILPYATVTGPTGSFDFASAATANIVPFAAYTTAGINGSTSANDVVKVTANDTLTGAKTVAAVLLSGNGLTVSGAFPLTLGTGALLTTGTTTSGDTISVAGLTLGSTEGIVNNNTTPASGASLTINSAITGTGGFTVGGNGTLALGGANSLSGTTTLNGGTLSLANLNALGGGSTLNLVAGTMQGASTLPAGTTLTVTNPVSLTNSMVSFAGTVPLIFSGTVTLNGFTDVVSAAIAGGGTTFSGMVTGAANLTKQGTGTLYLTNAQGFISNYTGQTNINAGIVNVQSSSALGASSSVVVANGATLQTQQKAVPVNNVQTVTITGLPTGGNFTLAFNGQQTANIAFNATAATIQTALQALSSIGANNVLVTGSAPGPFFVTFTGALAGAPQPALTFTNLFGNVGVNPTVVIVDGTSVQLSQSLVLNGSGVGGNGALENVYGNNYVFGNVSMLTPATIGVDEGTLTQSAGSIGGVGDLTKVGGGTLALTGTNTYLGQTNITNGIVQVNTSAFALGSVAGSTVVNAGATLQITGTAPINTSNNPGTGFVFGAETLVLNGTGYAGANLAGALVVAPSVQGILSTNLQANIVLNPGATIGVNSGVNLNATGVISGSGDLTKVGTGILNLQAGETYTGNTVVDAGQLVLQVAGSALNSSGFIVNPNAFLLLDNNGMSAVMQQGTTAVAGGTLFSVNMTSRLSATQGITLNAGTFSFIGNPGQGLAPVASSQSVGTITLGAGQSTIQASTGGIAITGSTSVLTIASLNRLPGGTVNFAGYGGIAGGTISSAGYTSALDVPFAQIALATVPTLVGSNGGILPYATVNGGDFATYDFATNSIAAFTGYVTSLAAAGPNDTVKLSAAETLTGDKTVNALLLAGGTVGEAGYTLTLAGGALATTAGFTTTNTIIGGTLAFGSNEGILQTNAAAITTLNSTITGSGGLTIGGGGTLNLPNANTYTGTTVQGNGILNVGNSASLGTGTASFVNGTVQSLAGVTLPNPVALNNSYVTLSGLTNLNLSGPVTATDNLSNDPNGAAYTNTVNVSTNVVFTVTISGAITGGTLSFTINNTGTSNIPWSGNGAVLAANIQAALNANATGTNTTIWGPGNTLVTGTGPFVITFIGGMAGVPLTLTANNNLLGTNTAIVVTSPVSFQGVPSGNDANPALATGLMSLSGTVSGTGSLNVLGTGTLVVSGNNTYSGGTFLNGPTVVAASNTAFGTGALTLTSGTLMADANAHTLANNLVINGGITLGASSEGGTTGSTNSNLTFSGNVLLTGTTSALVENAGVSVNPQTIAGTLPQNSLQVYNTTTFSGNVSGPGGLVVMGPGNLVLSGASNTYAGGTTLNSAGGGLQASFLNTGGTNNIAATSFNTAPAYSRIDPSVDYPDNGNNGLTYPTPNGLSLSPSVPINNIAITENGYLNIVNPGLYTFFYSVDDGGTMFIDGTMMADNDGAKGPAGCSATVNLSGGLHTFLVKYYQGGGGAGIAITYQGPDTNNVAILVPPSAYANPDGTAGTLQIANNNSLGSGPVSLSNGVLQANAAVTLANTVQLAGGPLPVALAGSAITITNNALLTGNINLSVNNTTTFNADIAGTSALTLTNQPVVVGTAAPLTGTGNLVITSPVSYTGSTTVSAGTLTLSGNGALTGTASTNAVQTLFFPTSLNNTQQGNVTGGNFTLTFNGATTGAITFSPTAATTAANIQTALNTLLGNSTSVVVSAQTSPIASLVVNNSSAGGIYITITFAGALAGAPQQLMTVNNVSLTGTNIAWSIATTTVGSPALVINSGGTVTLDNTTVNNNDRINDAAVVVFNGGNLNFLGTPGAASTETLGTTLYNTGNSTITTTAGAGGSVVLTANVPGRNGGGTANLVAGNGQILGSATNQIILNVPASAILNNGIIKGFTVTDGSTGGFNLATATGTSTATVAALTTYATLSTSGGNTSADNVLVTASTALTASDTVNAILIRGDGINISGAAGTTLTVGGTSGSGTMIVSSGGTTTGDTISVPTLALGNQEGVFITNSGSTTVTGTITGSGGLTASGAGSLTLASPDTYTGTTTLNGGTLTVASNSVLGALTLNGGTLKSSTSVTLTGAVTLNNSAVTLGGSNALVFTGAWNLAGQNDTLNVTDTTPVIIQGVIQDANNQGAVIPTGANSPAKTFTKTGAGTVILTGTNTYTALTYILGGTVNLQNSAGLGSVPSQSPITSAGAGFPATAPAADGTLVGSGATLQLQGAITLNEVLALNGGTLESLSGNNQLNGGILLNAPSTINVDVNQLTVTGSISGASDWTKTGGGTLILTGFNTYTGQTNINVGVVQLASYVFTASNTTTSNPISALGAQTGSVVVNSGGTPGSSGTLQLDSSSATTYYSKTLVLNGPGFGFNFSSLLLPTGALEDLNTTNNNQFISTWTGNIVLNTDSTISAASATTVTTPANLAITGAISGTVRAHQGGHRPAATRRPRQLLRSHDRRRRHPGPE